MDLCTLDSQSSDVGQSWEGSGRWKGQLPAAEAVPEELAQHSQQPATCPSVAGMAGTSQCLPQLDSIFLRKFLIDLI